MNSGIQSRYCKVHHRKISSRPWWLRPEKANSKAIELHQRIKFWQVARIAQFDLVAVFVPGKTGGGYARMVLAFGELLLEQLADRTIELFPLRERVGMETQFIARPASP
ncbi:MAG TPA: hypothetical protein VFF26_14540 [Gallionella sp.]|nr:hypothetical protein [Gallionella sp.]